MAADPMFSLGASIADLLGGGPSRRAEGVYVDQINKNATAAGNWQEAVAKRALNVARATVTPEIVAAHMRGDPDASAKLGYAAAMGNPTVNLSNLGPLLTPGYAEAARERMAAIGLGDGAVADIPRYNQLTAFTANKEYQPTRELGGAFVPDGASLAEVARSAVMTPQIRASGSKLEADESGRLWQIAPDGTGRAVNFGGESIPLPSSAGISGGGAGALEDAIASVIGPLGGRITSTTGGKHNPGSKHYAGNAIDIGMGRESPEQQAQILASLQNVPGIRVRDERTRPAGQAVWSGPHLHVERIGDVAGQVAQAGGYPRFAKKSGDGENKPPSGYRWAADGQTLVPIPGGPADRKANPTPADQAKDERQMRTELASLTKEPRQIMDAYKRVEAAANNPNAASDLSLIFGYMKMLDPGSVVREGEFANAQNAAGIPDRVVNLYNRAKSGERLSENQRTQFLTEAKKLRDIAYEQVAQKEREYGELADQYGYDPVRATGSRMASREARERKTQAEQLLREAREAIANGADKAAVQKRLREMGFKNTAEVL